ncbi:hypothetical protein KFK09_003997 [Dendrobium nobile]|uniref:Zinc knuckle CX2CX4HX4C domain-containing protein n=1 Tax=Dendrobium nobile TaxID=94219 RepID=A0A8T3C2S5_DENNO|nr:hypothetical protein KFK09_003997 [Dendrobium nobile]
MPHLPLQCWDEVNVAHIASSIGKPLMMDGVWVESISGRFFQRFEYEKISTLCYECGMVGHLKDDYKIKVSGTSGRDRNEGESKEAKEMEKVHEEVVDPSYGPWIVVKKKINRRPVVQKDKPKAIKK